MVGLDPNADSFDEPQTPDTTSVQAMPQYTHPNVQLQAALAKQRQKKQRDPASLARMIANAKRARPSTFRNG